MNYETVRVTIEWPKRRAGQGSGGPPPQGWRSGGVTTRKMLKFEMQFGAIWQEIDGSPVFTARCTLVQSAVLRSQVVCLSVSPSVTLVNCDHIG